MDPERWQKITGIFHAALLREAGQREAFLAEACGSDASLLRDVRALIDADAHAASNPDPLRPAAPGVSAGMQLGPYRIESLIGSGGMGEVYKARDTRLNRSVAIKVLPAGFTGDPELRQRFEREAQAIAALHHPNICVLHDVGNQDGFEFLVMEHLTGETLQDRLTKGPMPLEQALRYAIEIADALHSAHRAGILHRDLKPGNIMLTKDGAKLLDFGLAKFGAGVRSFGGATAMPTTPRTITAEGTIVGTFQYMAPEQLEGKDADERTDLFAFGAVLYEMITGRTAFAGDSRSSLIASILRDEPPPMSQVVPLTPPALGLVVRACLAKDPDARLQSARDVALQLRWIQSGTLIGGDGKPAPASSRWMLATAAAVLVFSAAAAASAYVIAQRRAAKPPPTFTRLTFRRGLVPMARFTPDGKSLIYTGKWDGGEAKVFSMRLDSREPQQLPVPKGNVLGVSREGMLAMLMNMEGAAGTLAQVPLGGGGVRELMAKVHGADWLPDGKSLAVLRESGPNRWSLEFPMGKPIHEWTVPNLPCDCIRVSPDGRLVGVLEEGPNGSGWISIVDRAGRLTRLSKTWPGVYESLAWSPAGDEIWFNASNVGLDFQPYAVTLDGRERILHPGMGSVRVQDATASGLVLITRDTIRRAIIGLAPGEQTERDLSWLDFGGVQSFTPDGRWFSFTESGAGAGAKAGAYVRATDGSPAVRFGDGMAGPLSPDGKQMVFVEQGSNTLKVLPLGAGDIRLPNVGSVTFRGPGGAGWIDATHFILGGTEGDGARRTYVMSVTGEPPRPITEPGVSWPAGLAAVISPDSRYVLARQRNTIWQVPIAGGERLPLKGVNAGETPLRYSADGRSMWLLGRTDRPSITIYRLDLATGQRAVWRTITLDAAGLMDNWFKALISADGNSYVYGFSQNLSDLYLAEGLR